MNPPAAGQNNATPSEMLQNKGNKRRILSWRKTRSRCLRRLPHSCSGKRLIWRWRAPAKNDEDEALQQLIGDFNLARIDLNSELSKSADKDQDKVNELNVKVNQLYNDIMANESMAAYNEAKAELESVMNYVNAIINTAVNGGDPMTVEEPQQGGCSGSCASCSGCH